MLELAPALGLAGAGFVAGIMNALAGGGSFVILPALMLAGSSPILANTTGSIALWPGAFATMLAFRNGLGSHRAALPLYSFLVLVGSLGGSALLLFSTNAVFLRLLPWLLLGATLLFLFGPRVTQAIRLRGQVRNADNPPQENAVTVGVSTQKSIWIAFLMTLIAIYGGYFGGGMGIMTLAALSLLGLNDIHEINALKSILIFFISTISVAFFIIKGAVDWLPALPMMVGNVLGGYVASHWALGIPKDTLRKVISGLCIVITLAYFIKVFGKF